MQQSQNIILDFMLKSNTYLMAKEDDINSRYIIATINDNGKPITLPTNAIATLNIMRSDGDKKSYRATIENNKVKAFLSSWAVEFGGWLFCDISILENEEKLTTTNFAVRVEGASCSSGDIEDAAGEDIITELIEMKDHYEEYKTQITHETITIGAGDWVYNSQTNKYECTIDNDIVTPSTYIIANDYTGSLLKAVVESNDGSYTIIAPVRPTGAITLLLIFLRGYENERSI